MGYTQMNNTKTVAAWRRYSLFLAGMVIDSVGIAFITRAGLGTSPISGTPFVLSLITGVSMGVYTFIFNMIYLALEAILRKQFTKEQAIQILVSLFFSICVDVSLAIIPSQYGGPYLNSAVFLVIGCTLAALGISFEVMADAIMLPAEAFVRALSKKINANFGNVKVGFDVTLTAIAMVLALINFHKLNGVREGTIVDALLVGQLIKFFTKHLEFIKRAWLGISTEAEAAAEQPVKAEHVIAGE